MNTKNSHIDKNIATIKVPRPAKAKKETKEAPEVENIDDLHMEDEYALRRMNPIEGELYFYTSEGNTCNLRNFYRGSSVFLILSGPSLNNYDLSLLRDSRGIVTMGVNNSWSVYKPDLWTCVDNAGSFLDIGWKDPSIKKFVPAEQVLKRLIVKEENGTFRKSQFLVRDMPTVMYYRRNDMFNSKTYLTEPTVNWGNGEKNTDAVGCKGGRSVMLAAVKILYNIGFRNVYLLGADFKMEQGCRNYAFSQHRSEDSVKGNNATYSSLNRRFISLLPEFKEAGFNMYNCYKDSGLTAFPYMSYEEAVQKASRICSKKIDTGGWYDRKAREKKEKEKIKKEKRIKPLK